MAKPATHPPSRALVSESALDNQDTAGLEAESHVSAGGLGVGWVAGGALGGVCGAG